MKACKINLDSQHFLAWVNLHIGDQIWIGLRLFLYIHLICEYTVDSMLNFGFCGESFIKRYWYQNFARCILPCVDSHWWNGLTNYGCLYAGVDIVDCYICTWWYTKNSYRKCKLLLGASEAKICGRQLDFIFLSCQTDVWGSYWCIGILKSEKQRSRIVTGRNLGDAKWNQRRSRVWD